MRRVRESSLGLTTLRHTPGLIQVKQVRKLLFFHFYFIHLVFTYMKLQKWKVTWEQCQHIYSYLCIVYLFFSFRLWSTWYCNISPIFLTFLTSLLLRPTCLLHKIPPNHFLHLPSSPNTSSFRSILHLYSQVRSRLTAGGRTVRRSLPGVMSWCDTITCIRGTSASSSWPYESHVSPYQHSKCKHQGYVCLHDLSS